MPAKTSAKTPVKTPAKKAARTPARTTTAKVSAPTSKTVAGNKPVAAKRAGAGKSLTSPVVKTAATVTPKLAATPPAAKAVPAVKEKLKKPKLVRDSFTMPEAEYQVLSDLKKACIQDGFAIKKSELLRIGVALLHKTEIAQLKSILASLPPLKAGRPKKTK